MLPTVSSRLAKSPNATNHASNDDLANNDDRHSRQHARMLAVDIGHVGGRHSRQHDHMHAGSRHSRQHIQGGATPEGVEIPRCLVDEDMQAKIKSMPKEVQPAIFSGPDPKWRYTWRIDPRPENTHFKELNPESIIPDGFPDWKETMDLWGSKMIATIEVVAEMAAIGFGLDKDAFTSLMDHVILLI
ncbi:hypothetical protein ZIOFF_052931 [Zingiber officinale]|uniref:Uncharacterized protein n=1 Tax=Zingiber officinale TaxID=94328 RepID=A0A8J5KLM3_ZINOF|nr:hypothetical protein ZIOFF_052931 [Zingiber officinale]